MFEFLKSETFNNIFSFLLGLACLALFKPACVGLECSIQKAPPYDEIKQSTYQVGSKCFQFQAEPIECPKKGVIEPFEQRFMR
jgi:hypothetical protein